MDLQCGTVVKVTTWRTPKVSKVVVVRTYKHGDGFLGLDIRTDIGQRVVASIAGNTLNQTSQEEMQTVYQTAKHYYESELQHSPANHCEHDSANHGQAPMFETTNQLAEGKR